MTEKSSSTPRADRQASREKKCHIAMELLYAKGEWYRLPKRLFQLRPGGEKIKDEAYTLAAILNQSAVQKAVFKHNGWFYFSAEKAEADTNFDHDRQERHIAKLLSYGLIKKRRAKKMCGRRQIKVVFRVLNDLLYETLQPETHLPQNADTASRKTRLPQNAVSANGEEREPYTVEERNKREECAPPHEPTPFNDDTNHSSANGQSKVTPRIKDHSAAPQQNNKQGNSSSQSDSSTAPTTNNKATSAKNNRSAAPVLDQTGYTARGKVSTPRNRPDIPPECIDYAKQLRTILNSRTKAQPPDRGNLTNRADEFRILQDSLKGDKEGRIPKLLTDYAKYINEIDSPTILNAKQFRKCFNWLEDAVRKVKYKGKRVVKEKQSRNVETDNGDGTYTMRIVTEEVERVVEEEWYKGDDGRQHYRRGLH